MSEQEKIERMSANLGAVIEYRTRVYMLQKSIRLLGEHLKRIDSQDGDLAVAMGALTDLLPERLSRADGYIEQNRTKVEAAVNALLDKV